jgi:predicted dehydrogenase
MADPGETRADKGLRIGVVGADINHALQYASVISPPEGATKPMMDVPPLDSRFEDRVATLRSPVVREPESRYTLEDIREDPAFRGVKVTCWWGEDRSAAEDMAQQLGVQRVYGTPEQMVPQVDAAMVCSYDANDHHRLAMPFLEAGIPTFVDKPFTADLDEAREMISTAHATGTVLFSSSPWKWSPAIQDLAGSLGSLGSIRTAAVSGPGIGGPFFYVTHSVETLQYLFGLGVEHVSCIRDDLHHAITLQYRDGRIGFVNAMREIAWMRHVVVYGENGYLEADVSDAHRYEGQVRTVVEFLRAVRSGKPPLPLEYPQEATKIMVAAERSADRGGERVYLKGLR